MIGDPAHIYTAEYSTKLQEQLDEPTLWKDICDVRYSDVRTFTNPYGTDVVASALTRSCPYTLYAVKQTTESLTISSGYIVPQFIDRADLAQSTFQNQMDVAQRQGVALNEVVETAALYEMTVTHGTDMGTETFTNTAGATAITVTTTNIDDIIRAVKREIREAAGESLANRNGIFFVWRPTDFELLEAVMQANGFVMADETLRNGATQGVKYMGATHYSSGFLTSTHVAAGVKKCTTVGILKATYGQIVITQDPELRSGTGIISRVDYGAETWYNFRAVSYDINVV